MTSQIENTNVFFGHYSQARFTDPAPIEWLVLKADERWALFLSKYALDGRPFNEAMVNTCWETSTLRAWLNGSFLQTAFSEEERTMIATATLNSDTDRTVNTRDRVFLLSASEVNQLMPKTELKQCKATQYAQEQGCNVGKSGFSWWWLRSAGRSPTHTAFVRGTGDINSDGNDVVNLYGAVRPALWLDLYS